MKKIALFIIVSVLFWGCAKHVQENYSSEDTINFNNTDEKDPVKKVIEAITENNNKKLLDALKKVEINQLIPSDEGEITFLMVALNSKKYYMAEILLGQGADPSIKSSKGLDAFELYEKDDVALKILNKEPLPEDKLLEILIDNGIKTYVVGVVDWVGTKKVNINQKVGRRLPPLLFACNISTKEEELYPIVASLLAYENVNVNIKIRGATPLSEARKNNYPNIINLLIANGAKE